MFAGEKHYEHTQTSYWALQQSELRPSCRFLALSSRNILDALSIIIKHNTTLAIVSGGHSSNPGGSNIDSGVTIDLGLLNEVTLTGDGSEVWIGPGARWGDVYKALEPYGLTVAGGRLSHVGVGGLVLGGGLSWFANQVGFVCDAVVEFETVTPGLRILRASATENANLFWALKGSLGAFGVITRIKMSTIPNTRIIGGGVSFHGEHFPEAFELLYQTALGAEEDLHTQAYLSFAYLESVDDFMQAAYVVNTAADNQTAGMRAWHRFPSTHSTLRRTTIAESAEELSYGNDIGMRRSKFTFTVTMEVNVMLALHKIFRDSASDVSFDRDGLFGVTYQPLTLPMIHHSSSESTSNIFSEAFGTATQPLLLISVEVWWRDPAKDHVLEVWMKGLEKMLLKYADESGVGHAWMYPNYAARWQGPLGVDVIGRRTVERMRKVVGEHDPDSVWPRLVPGVFRF